MKNDWILDVLADLKRFAHLNDLPQLAEQLAETADLAALELTATTDKARPAHGDDYTIGTNPGEIGDSRRA